MSNKPMQAMSYQAASNIRWLRQPEGLVVFLGENGAGKSRLLSEIAIDSVRRGLKTIVVANTPYDRFRRRSGSMHRLLVRDGSTVPERALKNAISNAISEDDVALRRVSRVLQHCGYQPDVGVQIKIAKGKRRTRAETSLLDDLGEADRREVLSLCEVLLRRDVWEEIFWFDFDSAHPKYSYRNILPRVLRWEALLKRMKIISAVRLYLIKEGDTISLAGASSGELSLIATMAFLATTFEGGACVVIDEPENSLHPRWQRGYLGVLLDVLKYRGARVFIATHSPLIISELDNDGIDNVDARTIILSGDSNGKIIPAPSSVEGILVEAFRTVTPANHYLSELLTGLLNDVDGNPECLASVRDKLRQLRDGMPDSRQEGVIAAVEKMANDIASGEYQ